MSSQFCPRNMLDGLIFIANVRKIPLPGHTLHICKVMRWCLKIRNWTKPYVFSHNVRSGGGLLLESWFWRGWGDDWVRCAIVFGDPGLQFALEWLLWRFDCCSCWSSSIVICKLAIAARSGNASSRWCLKLRNRTKPCLSCIKCFPAAMCGTWFLRQGRSSRVSSRTRSPL